MKKIALFLAGVALASFASCASPTSSTSSSSTTSTSSTYSNSVLPSKLSVKTPASLNASTGAVTGAIALSRSAALPRAATGSPQSAGYQEITGMTTILKSMMPMAVTFGVVADAVISQNSLVAGKDYKNQNVTLTQAMLNTINAQLPAGQGIPASDVGQAQALTDVNYIATGTGTLQNEIDLTTTMGSGTSATTQTITYKWSTDRTKVLMSMSMSGMTMEVSFDSTDGSGAFKVNDGSGDVFTMSMMPDANSTTDGVSLTSSVTTASSGTFSIYGYADDSGGIAFTSITASGSSAYWEEGFDSTGSLVFQGSFTGSFSGTSTDSYSTSATTESSSKTSYETSAKAASTLKTGASSLL